MKAVVELGGRMWSFGNNAVVLKSGVDDYLDWDGFGHAMAAHTRYRNQPKRRQELLACRRTQFSLAA